MNNPHRSSRDNLRQKNRNPADKGPPFDTGQIVLAGTLPTDLFSRIAEEAAKHVGEEPGANLNKSTQLRKFYDELCMWDSKVETEPDRFGEYLPFILMLKAKVAYAQGRKHVGKGYVRIFNHCLSQIENAPEQKTLHNLKLFMEAFIGFYKLHESRN